MTVATEHLYTGAENGDSLWSAGARDRFGSPLRYSGNDGNEACLGLLFRKSVKTADDYQSGPERPHSKGSADLRTGFSKLFI
jgi:hypothetical protein